MDLQALVLQVVEIAKVAGDAIMDVYDSDNFQVEHKLDDSPITIADKRANAIICEGLRQLEVQFPIVSEENQEIPYAERKYFKYFWLVDPLDGTKEFVKRNGEFTVNIALIHEGTPVLGVVYAPVLEEMYYAVENQGAYMIKNEQTSPIQAASFHLQDKGIRVLASRSHINEATEEFLRTLNEPVIIPQGSSLKFLMIARGDAHIYPRLGPTMEWDTGAAHAILAEAGGAVIQYDTKAPLQYNKESLKNSHFIALGKMG